MPRCISWRRSTSSTRSTAPPHRQMRSSTLDVVPARLGRRGRSPLAERRRSQASIAIHGRCRKHDGRIKQLGLDGQARQGDLARLPPAKPRTAIVAAYALNELTEPVREHLEAYLINAASLGARSLVIEPIARAVTPWWAPAAARVVAAGGRADEWKIPRRAAAPASPLRSRSWPQSSGNQIAIAVSAGHRVAEPRSRDPQRPDKTPRIRMIRGVSEARLKPGTSSEANVSTTSAAWLGLRRSGLWCDCDPADRRAAWPRRDVAARSAGR